MKLESLRLPGSIGKQCSGYCDIKSTSSQLCTCAFDYLGLDPDLQSAAQYS